MEGLMAKNTTKTIESSYTYNHNGEPVSHTQETEENLCSVELCEGRKGKYQIRSVKVYAATAEEAAMKALATFKMLTEQG